MAELLSDLMEKCTHRYDSDPGSKLKGCSQGDYRGGSFVGRGNASFRLPAMLAFGAMFHLEGCFLSYTWTPKVCKIMALMAIIMGLGLLFYILWGFR